MPIYSFYPTRSDGSSLSFELIDFESDAEALRHGRDVCLEHQSCDYVVVWSGDRVIGQVSRTQVVAA